MTNRTRKWIRAGLETLIHGGAAALVSTFAAANIDPKDWGWFTPNFWKMLGSTFMGNGGIRFIQWWAANPLPPDGDTEPPIPFSQPQISLNPVGKVQPVPPTETRQTP